MQVVRLRGKAHASAILTTSGSAIISLIPRSCIHTWSRNEAIMLYIGVSCCVLSIVLTRLGSAWLQCHRLLENNEEDIERWWFKL